MPAAHGCLGVDVGGWDGSRDGEEVTHYEPYSEKDSQLLEENFNASGFKATTALSLNGRKYVVRKTRKGWVQEPDGQPNVRVS